MPEVELPSSSRDASSNMKSAVQHGRTDGQTNEELLTAANHVTDRNAHTRVQDELGLVTPGDVIQARQLWRTNERHGVVRTGERDPIPSYVRAAVWWRDGGKCEQCLPEHRLDEPLHLDHIQPWSAGGSDTTDNLRLLCEKHNLRRSNFIDFARPKRPATWWCANCYDLDKHVWDHSYPLLTCPTHGRSYTVTSIRCRVARAYAMAWVRKDERPTWHERTMLTRFTEIAYCAHCNTPGLTSVVL